MNKKQREARNKAAKTYRNNHPEKVKAAQKSYRENNKEKRRAANKAWREANWEKKRVIDKIYREAHKEKAKAYQKAYYQANKERIDAHNKAYLKAHPEKVKAYSKISMKRNPERYRKACRNYRALKYTTKVESINEKRVFIRDGWVCQICHKKIKKALRGPHPLSPSIDHIIPLGKGGTHTYKNVQSAHLGCNLKKNANVLPQGEQLRIF